MIKEIEEDKLIDALYTAFYCGYIQSDANSMLYKINPKTLETFDFSIIKDGFCGICGDIVNSLKEKENSLELLQFNYEGGEK